MHQLQCISERLADRRVLQADLNIERAMYYQSRLNENPRQIDTPSIISILSRPSFTMANNLAQATV